MPLTNGLSDRKPDATDEDPSRAQPELRDMSNGGFFWLNNEVLDSDKCAALTSTDIAVLCAISYHIFDEEKGCFPSRQKISDLARCSKAQVSRSVKKVEELGLLRVERRESTTNRYWMLRPETEPKETGGSDTPDQSADTDTRSWDDNLKSGDGDTRLFGHDARSGTDDMITLKQYAPKKTVRKKMNLKKRPSTTTRVRGVNVSLPAHPTGQDDSNERLNSSPNQSIGKASGGEPSIEQRGENEIPESGDAENSPPEDGDTEARMQSLLNELHAALPQSDLDDHLPRLRRDLRELLRSLAGENSEKTSVSKKVRAVVTATYGSEHWNELHSEDREAVMILFRELYQSSEWHLGDSQWVTPFAAFSIAAHLDQEGKITPSHIRKVATKIRTYQHDEVSPESESQGRRPDGIEEVVDLAVEMMNDGDLSRARNVTSRVLATGTALRYYYTFDPNDWVDEDGQPIRSWRAHARHWLRGCVDTMSRADIRSMRNAGEEWIKDRNQ